MMKNKARDAATYRFQEGEPILLDANIWLFLHPPAGGGGSGWAKEYGTVYKRLLAAKAQPVTDALVLSEYLNRYFRLEYEGGWKDQFRDLKAFRQSTYFKPLAEDAIAEVQGILARTAVQDTPLRSLNLKDILAGTEAGTIDFNDGVLVESCRHHGWKLLTNDSDCTTGGIEVLTMLPSLLKACS